MKKVLVLIALSVALAGCGPSISVCYNQQKEIVALTASGEQLMELLTLNKGMVNCDNGNRTDGETIDYALSPDFYLTDGKVEISVTDEATSTPSVPRLQVTAPRNLLMTARNIKFVSSDKPVQTPNVAPVQTGVVINNVINNDVVKK